MRQVRISHTDAPWCDIRPTHASAAVLAAAREANPDVAVQFDRVKPEKWRHDALVKGRNEPSAIVDVALVVAQLKGVSLPELADQAYKNTQCLFALNLYNK